MNGKKGKDEISDYARVTVTNTGIVYQQLNWSAGFYGMRNYIGKVYFIMAKLSEKIGH